MGPNDNDLTIEPADPDCADARGLIDRLERELVGLYGDEGKSDFLPDDVRVPGGIFLMARVDGRPVACGAVRPMADGAGEVKRMFVAPDLRGCKIASRILAALEESARGAGCPRLRLETGTRQPEAIRLYERAGYVRIENYGIYVGNPLSRCYEKLL